MAGKNWFHVFDFEQDRSARPPRKPEKYSSGFATRKVVLHYQFKVNMCTGMVLGTEAVVRWQHPAQGLLPPVTFLPVTEGHPLAIDIGEWVVNSALSLSWTC